MLQRYSLFLVVWASVIACEPTFDVELAQQSTFTKLYGNADYTYEAVDLIELEDGSFYILGTKVGPDTSTIVLIKTDAYGQELFQTLEISHETGSLTAKGLALTLDGNTLLVLGQATHADGSENIEVYRINSSHHNIDDRLTAGIGSYGESILRTSTGDFIIIGHAKEAINGNNTDMAIWQFRPEADTILLKTQYGLSGINDEGAQVVEENSGSYLWLGNVARDNPSQSRLIRSNTDFDLITNEDYNLKGGNSKAVKVVKSAGSYVIAENHEAGIALRKVSDLSLKEEVVIELEPNFNQRKYQCFDICRSSPQTLLLTGSVVHGGNINYFLVAINDAGEKQWEKDYGGNKTDIGKKVVALKDGNYAILGESGFAENRILSLIKVDKNGEFN